MLYYFSQMSLLYSLSHLVGYENKISRREIDSIDQTSLSWWRNFLRNYIWVGISGLLECQIFSSFAWSGMNTLTEICSEYSEWTMNSFNYYIWGYIFYSPCSWLNHGLSQTFSAKPYFASASLGLILVCLGYSWFFLAILGLILV